MVMVISKKSVAPDATPLLRNLTDIFAETLTIDKPRYIVPIEQEAQTLAEMLPDAAPPQVCNLRPRPIPHVTCSGICVTALDASVVQVGETPKGSLVALRAVLVTRLFKPRPRYRVIRWGPFLVHLTDTTYPYLIRRISRLAGLSEPDARQPPLLTLLNAFERTLWTAAASIVPPNSILLVDGALAVPISNPSIPHTLSDIARKRCLRILGVCKSSRIALHLLQEGATLPPLHAVVVTHSLHVLVAVVSTHVFLHPFRIDVVNPLPELLDLGLFVAATDLTDGYPEPLRLAHIYAIFTTGEVLAIRRALLKTYGIPVTREHKLRHRLFGPFAHHSLSWSVH